jgi:hypothetical protein
VQTLVRWISVAIILASAGMAAIRIFPYFVSSRNAPAPAADADASVLASAPSGPRYAWTPAEMKKAPLPGRLGPDFDLSMKVTTHPNPGEAATVGAVWNFRDERNFRFVRLSKGLAVIGRVEGGVERVLAQTARGMDSDRSCAVRLRQRGTFVALDVDSRLAAAAYDAEDSGGDLLLAGAADFDPRVDLLEHGAPLWADDFMRMPDDLGDWSCRDAGRWGILSTTNPARSANAFIFKGAGRNSLAMAGQTWWDRYTFKAALRGPEGGRMGVAFALRDENNGYIFRWSAAKPAPNGAEGIHEIVRRVDGREEVLASAPGGYAPGQWYAVTVDVAAGRADVSVDDRCLISVTDDRLTGGRIGLWADADNQDQVCVGSTATAAPVYVSGRVVAFTPDEALVSVSGEMPPELARIARRTTAKAVPAGEPQPVSIARRSVVYIRYGGVCFDDVRVTPLRRLPDGLARPWLDQGGLQPLVGGFSTVPAGGTGAAADCGLRVDTDGPALALFGDRDWKDYRFAADVSFASGAVGLLFDYRDETRYDAFTIGPEGAALVRIRDGRPRVVAGGPVSLPAPGPDGMRHVRIEVVADNGHVTAFLDGKPAAQTIDPDQAGGRVGLTARSAPGAVFRNMDIDFIAPPARVEDVNAVFNHERSMEMFADEEASDWKRGGPVAGAPAYFYRAPCYGDTLVEADVDEQLPVRPAGEGLAADEAAAPLRPPAPSAALEAARAAYARRTSRIGMALAKDADVSGSGYVLTFAVPARAECLPAGDPRRQGATPPLEVRLLRDNKPCELSDAEGRSAQVVRAPMPSVLATAGLRQAGEFIVAMVNGRAVAWFRDPSPKKGGRVAFYAAGLRVDRRDVRVYNRGVQDFQFNAAPSDWRVGLGTWEVANRWQCDPRWSFLAGWYRDWPRVPLAADPQAGKIAAVWNKRPIRGDFSVEYFVAPKMQQQSGPEQNFVRDFNVSVCADGRDLTSGYVFSYGAADNRRTALYRKGVLVAQSDWTVPSAGLHNRWFGLKAVREGDRLRFFLRLSADGADEPILDYEDPDPLPASGYLSLWTFRMGLMLGRVRVSAESVGPADAPWGWADAPCFFTINGEDADAYK